MSWVDKGIVCYVSKKKKGKLLELPSENEEKCSCYIPARKSNALVQLHHLSIEQNNDQLYCTDEEVGEYKNTGYKVKGGVVHVWPNKERGLKVKGGIVYVQPDWDRTLVPLFRAYDPDAQRHFYSTSVEMIDSKGPILSRGELRTELKRQLGDHLVGNPGIYIADNEYFCTTRKTAEVIIEGEKLDDKYDRKEQVGDCDDYAHLLKSAFIVDAWYDKKRSKPYAFGIVWDSSADGNQKHAMNFVMVNEDGKCFKLYLIEPDAGSIGLTPNLAWYDMSKPTDKERIKAVLGQISLVIC